MKNIVKRLECFARIMYTHQPMAMSITWDYDKPEESNISQSEHNNGLMQLICKNLKQQFSDAILDVVITSPEMCVILECMPECILITENHYKYYSQLGAHQNVDFKPIFLIINPSGDKIGVVIKDNFCRPNEIYLTSTDTLGGKKIIVHGLPSLRLMDYFE